jgi:Ca-activated chloride channel family protein
MLPRPFRFALLALAVLAPASLRAQAEPLFSFASPQDGELVIGSTTFRFVVAEPLDRIDVYVAGKLVGAARPPGWSLAWEAPGGMSPTEIRALAYREGKMVGRVSIRTADVSFSETVDVTAVQVYPVVTDRRGRYIDTLRAEDFELIEGGRKVPIESFAAERAPLHLSILIDTSMSMRDNLSIVQDAAVQFLDHLEPGDQISVYGFNHGLLTKLQRGALPALAKEKIRELQADGGTALYDAVIRVLTDMAPKKGAGEQLGRQAILVFSDGIDERSLAPLARAVDKARQSDVVLYAIATGSQRDDLLARDDLKQLASETGGELYVAEKLKELPGIFAQVAKDLASQYRLSFTPPSGVKGLRRIEVRVRNDDYRVRCRQSYSAP